MVGEKNFRPSKYGFVYYRKSWITGRLKMPVLGERATPQADKTPEI